MNRIPTITKIVLAIMLGHLTLMAQIELSGFADILYTQDLSDGGTGHFGYGQFEVDLSGVVMKGVTFEGAAAYNADAGAFEAGAGFLDIHLMGSEADHPARGGVIQHSGLMLGQFDVPFGLDYLRIPSPDRRLISGPLLNQKTIDGWNDVGLNLYGELSFGSFNLFAVNGAQDGIALGGRLAVPLGDMVEFGASYATQTAENDSEANPALLGADILVTSGPAQLTFEFQQATAVLEGDFDSYGDTEQHSGYYAELDLDLAGLINVPFFVVGRFGSWEKDNETAQRVTLGLGHQFSDSFEFRAEYLSDSIDDNTSNQLALQTVVSF